MVGVIKFFWIIEGLTFAYTWAFTYYDITYGLHVFFKLFSCVTKMVISVQVCPGWFINILLLYKTENFPGIFFPIRFIYSFPLFFCVDCILQTWFIGFWSWQVSPTHVLFLLCKRVMKHWNLARCKWFNKILA